MYKARDIALWLMKEKHVVEMPKVMMLLYYFQGAHLAIFDTPLFEDEIQAHGIGPVVPNILNLFDKDIDISEITTGHIEESIIDLLNEVYEQMSLYDTERLGYKVRNEQPWLSATCNGTYLHRQTISTQIMKEYFLAVYIEYEEE